MIPGLHYVIGPPGAGKTTWVAQHRSPGDLVLDLDALAVALGSQTKDHHQRDHMPQHKSLARWIWRPLSVKMEQMAKGANVGVWIIHSDPPPPVLSRYGKKGTVKVMKAR